MRAFSIRPGGGVVEIASFLAYDPEFAGGVRRRGGRRECRRQWPTSSREPGPSGGPHVRAFSLAGGGVAELASFWAYAPSWTEGVFVAGGDVNGDGIAEIITGTARAGGPVRVFTVGGPGRRRRAHQLFCLLPRLPGLRPRRRRGRER